MVALAVRSRVRLAQDRCTAAASRCWAGPPAEAVKAVSASAFVDRLKDNAKAAKAGAGAREVMKNPDSVRSPTQSAVASDDDAVLPDLLSSLSDSLSQARLVGRPKAVRPSGERRRARSEEWSPWISG